jgi:hypothetical protein
MRSHHCIISRFILDIFSLSFLFCFLNLCVRIRIRKRRQSSVGPPNETIEETEPGQGHVRNRVACPSPNVKRPRSCLAESAQIAARENPRGGAIGRPSSVENDGGRDEEDSNPFLVTTRSALVASYPDQEEVVQEESTHYKIPSGWKRVKLEPDC